MKPRRIGPLCPECNGVRTVVLILDEVIEQHGNGAGIRIRTFVTRPCPTCQEQPAPRPSAA